MSWHKNILSLIIIVASLNCKAGGSFVFMGDTTNKLFYARNNEFYSPDKSTLVYFQKGNIIFKGTTDDRSNIFLLTSSMDLNSGELELLYEKDNRNPTYSFSKNKFYLGKNESEEFRAKNELIHVMRAKKWLAFYASYNDSLLCFYAADSLPSYAAVLVAYTLARKLNLEAKLSVKQNRLPFEDTKVATIKPLVGDQVLNEWIWDGKVLRPRWNVDPRLAWKFDGQTVKPFAGNNMFDQYTWDGETFKPAWRDDNTKEWAFNGNQLKPLWGNDLDNEYIIEKGTVKPANPLHPEKEWKMDGDFPIPVLILILSGIARPY
jgi:hypothetical protein